MVLASGLVGALNLKRIPVLGRLTVQPSQKRAAGPAEQLVRSANAGNVTAAAAILYRTTVGIQKERAVWLAALQRVNGDMVMLAQKHGRELLPLVDHTGPETAARTALANVRDSSSFATPVSARVKQPKGEAAAPPARSRTPRASRAPRAAKRRMVWRYNPDTGRRTRVDSESEEAFTWSSRKPSRRSRQLATRAEKAATSAAVGGVQAILRATARNPKLMLARAGVVIGGLAAGYWIGSQLNTHLAGRHRKAQDAGVQAALAFRAARREAAAAQGRALTPAQSRSLGNVYKAQLIALGYDPVTFTKRPSLVDRFFLGQEE